MPDPVKTPDPNTATPLASIKSGRGGDALDKLFAEVTPDPAGGAPSVEPVELPEPAEPPVPVVPVSPPAPPVPLEPPTAPVPVVPPVPPTPGSPPASPPDWMDEYQLPQHTKPKTAESFAALKSAARTKLQEREAALAEAQKSLEDAKSKASQAMTPEQKAEFDRLAKLEKTILVQTDDYFKTNFDAKVVDAEQAVYTKLEQVGMSKENIDKIKNLGGPAKVDWDPLQEHLPTAARRFIDSKLVEIESVGIAKARALEEAKQNADVFLKQRRDVQEQERTHWATDVQKATEAHLSQLEWLKPRAVAAAAKPEERVSAEQHNKFVVEMQGAVKDFLTDNTPQTKALLILGTVQAFRRKMELEAVSAAYKEVEARATKAETELEKIKKSSSVARTGHAPPAGQSPAPRQSILMRGDAALDALRASQTGS